MMLTPSARSRATQLTLVGCLLLAALATTALADLTGAQVATKPVPVRLQQLPSPVAPSALEQTVFDQINAVRKDHGLTPVRLATDLLPVARQHSDDQARRNTLTHRNADGKNAGARLDAAQVSWIRYGENVALVKGYRDPAVTVVDAWMRSPGHAANVLDPRLAESAVGIAQSADGTYFLTQVFVTR